MRKNPVSRSVLFILISLFFAFAAEAQNPVRLEFPVDKKSSSYQLIPYADSGFVLFYPTEKAGGKSRIWKFETYNKLFVKTAETEAPAFGKANSYMKYADEHSLYILFYSENELGSQLASCIRYQPKTGTINGAEIQMPDKREITAFLPWRDGYFIGVYSKNNAELLHFNTKSGNLQIKELGDQNDMRPLSIAYTADSNLLISCIAHPTKKSTVLSFSTMTADGYEKSRKQVECDEYLTDIVKANDKQQLYFGLYNDSKKRNEYGDHFSTGFFSLSQGNFRFFPFRDIAQKHMDSLQEETTEYLTHINPVLSENGNYLFYLDAWVPDFQTGSIMTFDYYGRMLPSYQSRLNGYHHKGCFVLELDEKGSANWSGMYNPKNLLAEIPSQITQLIPLEEDYLLCYSERGNINSFLISNGLKSNTTEISPIEPLFPDDRLREHHNSRIIHWYHDYYLVSGYQRISNIKLKNNKDRYIYFINLLCVN